MGELWRIDEQMTCEVSPQEGVQLEVLCASDEASGWASRLTGLDADYEFVRVFLAEASVREATLQGLVHRRYLLRRPGFYQCHSPLLGESQEFVFLQLAQGRAQCIPREVVMASLRARSGYTLAHVEAACGGERWRDALVAALHLEGARERAAAMQEIRTARQAREQGSWCGLCGSERQQRWGLLVRERAARRLTELFDGFYEGASEEGAMSQARVERYERLSLASGVLRREPDAQFYITQRFELESDEEAFLAALTAGVSQRHEDGAPLRLRELDEPENPA